MKKYVRGLLGGALCFGLFGCATEEVDASHRARMFERTGIWAMYAGGEGFSGPILGSGTHYTGLYNELRHVDCSQNTAKVPMTALTSDGVQFSLDVYVTYETNCDDADAFNTVLQKVPLRRTSDGKLIIVNDDVFSRYVRPPLGGSVREAVSPYKANDINANRVQIFKTIETDFMNAMNGMNPRLVNVSRLELNNLDFPDSLEEANTRKAKVAIEKDAAIAEREKVEEQILTAQRERDLAMEQGKVAAAKIDEIGAAWRRNPEYLHFRTMQEAGQKGNMIVMGDTEGLILNARK